jgi:hypothetical protein
MNANHGTTLAAHIRTYIRAKDENRPHLMQRAFAESATLEMVVRTAAIAFPPITHGRGSITDVLVRRFAEEYENVYTFCLSDAPSADCLRFKCAWFVVMSEKDSGQVRVGYGHYDWSWSPKVSPLVNRLAITIERMETFPASVADPAFDWVEGLTYPWCPAGQLGNQMPRDEELRTVVLQAVRICVP